MKKRVMAFLLTFTLWFPMVHENAISMDQEQAATLYEEGAITIVMQFEDESAFFRYDGTLYGSCIVRNGWCWDYPFARSVWGQH